MASAQGNPANHEFLAAYREGEKNLRAFYANAKILGRYYVRSGIGGADELDAEWVFLASEPFFRLDFTRKRPSKRQQSGRLGAMVAGPYGFRVKKEPGASQFALDEATVNPKRVTEYIRANGRACFAPYSFLGADILELFSGEDFYVKEMSQIQNGNTKLVKVSWGRRPAAFSSWSGWFLFSPDQSWALQDYDWRSLKADYSSRAKLEYHGQEGNIPLLRKVLYENVGDAGGLLKAETYEIGQITPGSIAEGEFRLTAFGLPEPGWAPPPRTSYWYLWFIAIAAVSLIVGVYLLRRARRPGPTTPAPRS
jgi:hypothetical protein